MRFDNTYARLPEPFFQRINPVPVRSPRLIRLNTALAETLELDLPDDAAKQAAFFSGNALFPGSEPIAQAYAGHQFGNFVPQLGDGRAVLLGEVVTSRGQRFDMQLKGSGITRFSRNGDGRSPLGPVIREYVVSEAMHAMGIPTSRSLAMVETGETVHRETPLPGAILTRVAASHIRIGTFEYFAARNDFDAVRQLADFAIARHYPEVQGNAALYAEFFRAVCRAQARLVADWLAAGFIHGVMNTDNTAISGETIDYGPCAFMDHYNPAQVFSSIDIQGRYAYNNQSTIAQWNLACLGGCLLPLLDADEAKARSVGEEILATFPDTFKAEYQHRMCRKIGLPAATDTDFSLVRELLAHMHRDHADFTLTFRSLGDATNATGAERFLSLFSRNAGVEDWIERWRQRAPSDGVKGMHSVNPAFIPRNHRLEQAIRAAEDDRDDSMAHRLIDILGHPYEEQPDNAEFMLPPAPEERVHQTFCGT